MSSCRSTFIAVVNKTEAATTAETSKSEVVEEASPAQNIEHLAADNPDTDLTLSACEYVPDGELWLLTNSG